MRNCRFWRLASAAVVAALLGPAGCGLPVGAPAGDFPVPGYPADFDGVPDVGDPGDQPSQANAERSTPLFWNAWLSDSSRQDVAPVRSLADDANYDLTLDLSGIDYSRLDPNVAASAPSDAVKTEIVQGLSRFEVLLLADSRYFERIKLKPWEGDLQARIDNPGPYPAQSGSPFADRAATPPPFRFGRLQLQLRTKRQWFTPFPIRTRLGLSVWKGGRPIDTIEVPVCIQRGGDAAHADLCKSSTASAMGGIARVDDAPAADASLQIVGEGQERIWAVFRRKGESLGAATKWTVSSSEEALRQKVNGVLRRIEKSKTERLPALGKEMLSALFGDPGKATQQARGVVEASLRTVIESRTAALPRPTLLLKATPSTLVPIGLAALPGPGEPLFLGEQLAIEVPLGPQRDLPRSSSHCDLAWISVMPPMKSESQGADSAMAELRTRLALHEVSPLLRRWESPESCGFSQLERFGHWMDSDESEESRAALLVLSHHAPLTPGASVLYFETNSSDAISPLMLRRKFAAGSLAILNACGSDDSSPAGFVSTLNALGFEAIVATATEVHPSLAGDFTYCLAQNISAKPMPLGVVFDATTLCLAELDDGLHGARAFSYTLLGDRSTTICSQPENAPCPIHQ